MADVVDRASEPSGIAGLEIITLKQVTDERGIVREFFRSSTRPDLGPWHQVNVTETRVGGVRGMHAEDMTKLVAVVSGEAHGAYLDLRRSSSTFGVVETVKLQPGTQVLVPAGVANGFQALVDTQYLYCFDAEWEPDMAGEATTPIDPDLDYGWPLPIDAGDPSQLSAKDRNAPTFAQLTGGGA